MPKAFCELSSKGLAASGAESFVCSVKLLIPLSYLSVVSVSTQGFQGTTGILLDVNIGLLEHLFKS